MLKGIDMLVYDIQDNGCRSFTYISTMGLAMEAAAENNIEFVVLDRPNPLSGNKFEGNITEDKFISFVSQFKIPYIYGLTCGELSMMLNDQTNASKYFNMIRARARNCGNGVNPADLTGAVTKKEIMDERAREFAMEGERFFDLVRWHEAYNELNGSRMEWWDESFSDVIYQEPKNDFFPLPAIEVAKNSALKQYAGR